jgi:hypothetical protein
MFRSASAPKRIRKMNVDVLPALKWDGNELNYEKEKPQMNILYSLLWSDGQLEVVLNCEHDHAAGVLSLSQAKAVVRRFNRFYMRQKLVLYHVTYATAVPRILKEGLKPLWKSPGSEEDIVYLFGNRSDAEKYLLWRHGWPGRKRKQDVLRITLPRSSLVQIVPDVEDYMIEQYHLPLKHFGVISPEHISRLVGRCSPS